MTSKTVTTINFPDRYELWLDHDLAKFRPEFYKTLRVEDQPAVWNFIESNYLLKFPHLFRIEFEWGADGIWRIPFPGSVSLKGCYGPEVFNHPPTLAEQLQEWHNNIDIN